ncbi:hypothetical protein CABS01_16666 [Colletotrichum abscissum]|uniref:uncharacterized protein n=1 Tax=Colletotrichum abscissum TaxID=1671311 RepID=UPI0027D50D2E|nr:uncharacterized protein CABS01_16666 [Colletotrichum abscissum]KAK1517388.1 hypothetical protein CABS01_16666 [Colletotrichum abscissum]
MKFRAILFLAASAFAAPTPEAIAEPAPAPADIGATTKAQRLLCSGLWTGNDLSFGDLKWAMENRRDELQLKAGWWNEVNTACKSRWQEHCAEWYLDHLQPRTKQPGEDNSEVQWCNRLFAAEQLETQV